MAKNVLPTNFQDDILNANMNGRRRYKLIQNADGTVSLEDASAYDQVGSNFGAGQINATNTAVNASADAGKIIDNTDDIMANTQKGMMAGALALKEVNSNLGGNILSYNESEDAYYIQYGADSVPKKLGSTTSDMYLWTSSPVDIKALMPDIYDRLTTADFMVGCTGAEGGFDSPVARLGAYAYCSHNINYNAATGSLTFSPGSARNGNVGGYSSVWVSTRGYGTCFAVYKGTIAGVAQ